MVLLLGTFLTLLSSSFAEYSINFGDPSSTLQYTYDSPADFTNALVKLKLNLDYQYYTDFFASGDGTPMDIVTVRSPSGADDLYDYMAVQLMSSGMEGPPLVMVIMSSPLSSQNFGATTFCINMMPHDFSDKLITVSKTGESFILDIEGLEQNEQNFFCQNVPIGKPGSGRMDFSTVMIGPNLKGCISLLDFPGVNLLPADDCGFPVPYFSGEVTYFEGTCANIPETSSVCPTTKPPTTEPTTEPEPTTKEPTEPVPPITTPKKTTPPKEPTEKATTEPEPEPQTPAKTEKPETEKPETEKPKTDKPETEQPEKPDTEKPETDAPVEKTEEPESNTEHPPLVVVDNETEDKEGDEDNEYEVVETEKATGDEGTSSSVVIIICVVSAGIIVIVILLYVGYRFHFRDKGSYKLEETKGEPNGEDFGNEYTDLNPTSKDQEWYL